MPRSAWACSSAHGHGILASRAFELSRGDGASLYGRVAVEYQLEVLPRFASRFGSRLHANHELWRNPLKGKRGSGMRLMVVLCGALTLSFSACSDHRRYDGWQTAVETGEGPLGAYRLGAGDVVRVTVFREPHITGEYGVDTSGALSVPLIGQLTAGGLTTAQVEYSLARRLRGDYVTDPKVSVEVVKYRSFYILGEVRRSGAYPYIPRMTLLDAVAVAGGFTYRANTRKIYVRRAGTDFEEVYEFDRHAPVRIWVYPGDNIRIPERFF